MVITVTDTGCGMSDQQKSHIFDEFGHSTHHKEFAGSGLGMSIVKKLADIMGGSITVKSKKGRGTTMTFEVPVETFDKIIYHYDEGDDSTVGIYTPPRIKREGVLPEQAKSFSLRNQTLINAAMLPNQVEEDKKTATLPPIKQSSVEQSSARQSLADHLKKQRRESMATILIVDDVNVNVRLLVAIVKSIGRKRIDIHTAENGKVAVEKFNEHDPHIIFMDIDMPVMNGYDACKKIRETSDIPIYAVTSNALNEDQEPIINAGFTERIVKPFLKPDIKSILHKHFPHIVPPTPVITKTRLNTQFWAISQVLNLNFILWITQVRLN